MANGANRCANVSKECVNDANGCANECANGSLASPLAQMGDGRVQEVPASIPGAAPSACVSLSFTLHYLSASVNKLLKRNDWIKA